MSHVFQTNIRGGHSFVNTRHGKKDDTKKQSLLYADANNLYGCSMRYPLPYKDFRWMTKEEVALFDPYKDIQVKNGPGYVCQVDLEYPKSLHDKHNAFPLAPENKVITTDDLSPLSKDYLNRLPHHRGKYKSSKLTATFNDRYVN